MTRTDTQRERTCASHRKARLGHFLALSLALSAAIVPVPAIAAISGTQAAKADHGQTDAGTDEEDVRHLLDAFRSSEVSLNQAISIAERLHSGSRAVQISFETSSPPAYRVRTVRSGELWENVIDANTARITGTETMSPLKALDGADRDNIVALKSIRQKLSDAVAVGERAASGKALGGGLMNQDGKLNFVVVVACGDSLKQVMLEPPHVARQGTAGRANRFNRARGD